MEKFDAEAMLRNRREAEHRHSIPGICERYMDDVEEYLKSKITGLEDYVYKEIATYCANRLTVTMADIIAERDREWSNTLKRTARRDQVQRLKEIKAKHSSNLSKED